nr:hypothetical protein [Paenibacillus chitinolyticus]
MQHLCIPAAGKEQELFDLMAADIAQDAAVLGPLEEPAGTRSGAQPVRAETEHLHDAPDCSIADELPREDGALDMQALAKIDRVLAAGFGYRPLGRLKLVRRGKRRFVGEVVLAAAHHFLAEGPAIARNGGGSYQLYFFVL